MLQKLIFYFFIALGAWCTNSDASDLLQVFQQAYQYDPQFRLQAARWHSQEQKALVARSLLLPELGLKNSYGQQAIQNAVPPNPSTHNTSILSLSLSQPIFNAADWFGYKGAKIETKAFQREYGAALQDLMVRTTEFYFDIIEAQYQLDINQYARDDYARLLKWTKNRFEAGLTKTVDVDTIEAAYQQSLSAVIDAQNTLYEKWAHLQAVTGIQTQALASLKANIPLVRPFPLDLQAWIASVREKNLTVLANQYKLQAKKMQIKMQQAGHYPTLNANVNQNYTKDDSPLGQNGSDRNIMLTVSLPIYSGGKTTAQTRQAAYDYQALLEQAEQDYRQEREKVQDNYAGVINGIKQLQVDSRILAADQRALHSVNLAYEAGLSGTNMNTVIAARANLYQHRLAAFQHKRNYIVSLIKLKKAAGVLSVADLVQLNSWLQSGKRN